MIKEYTLIHPDIDPGRGRTRQLLDELIRSWREGRNEGAAEIAAVVDLLSTDEALPNIAYRLTEGGAVHRLAQEFTAFLTRVRQLPPFAQRIARERGYGEIPLSVSCLGSATGALYAALSATDVAGGEVIVTSLNYVGVLNAILLAGATPRFVDIDERSWCMDPQSAARAVTKKTRAILLTHLNRFVDIEPYYDLIERGGLDIPLIQDASLAVGSTREGLSPGVINIGPGGVTVFSLATSKPISGLGGAVVTSHDASHVHKLVSIAYQGLDLVEPGKLASFGANVKMNDLNAVIALERLKRCDEIFERRRKLKATYDNLLAPLAADGKIVLQNVDTETVVTHYAVLLPDRDRLAQQLYEERRIYLGMWHVHHLQRIYRQPFRSQMGTLPRTEAVAERFTMLPFHTRLTEEDVAFIGNAIVESI